MSEIIYVDHGSIVEIEVDGTKVYEGVPDVCQILRSLGFDNITEIYSPLYVAKTEDDNADEEFDF